MTAPPELAARVLPSDVIVVEGPTQDYIGELHPLELDAVRHAVESRRREFSTGRAFARQALARLGAATTGPIMRGTHGAPTWPAGVCGSVTHTRSYCAVAIASTDRYASIGLDVEIEAGVHADLAPIICTPAELRRIEQRGPVDSSTLAAVFSAKECFYKCQHPLTGRFLDFHDVEVEFDAAGYGFRVRPLGELALPRGGGDDRGYPGMLQTASGLVAAAMVIETHPRPRQANPSRPALR